MKTFKPLFDRVLLKPYPKEDKTDSGIIIPDTVVRPVIKCKVVDIGKGTWAKDTGKWMPTKVKKDSDVYLFDNVAMPITVGEDEMLVCGENEILGEA